MKKLLLCALILISTANANVEWNFEKGSFESMLNQLDRYEGDNFLYNCRVIIEKIKYEDKTIYWVSLFDLLRGNKAALSFEAPNDREDENKYDNEYIVDRTSGPSAIKKVESFRISNDFNGDLVQINYREFYTSPLKILNALKCAPQFNNNKGINNEKHNL